MTRIARALMLAVVLVALSAGPAPASVGGEVAAGGRIAQQVQAGTLDCGSLSATQFERLGEYVMDRMAGSRPAHLAMNARMDEMIGPAATDRMHEQLGRRYAGCATAGAATPMGPGMMRGAGWGAMMGARDLAWMGNGAWRHMSSADWQRMRALWATPAAVRSSGDGWSAGAVIAVIAGALLLGAALAYAALGRHGGHGRHGRGGRSAGPTAA